jgi:hypothetical protein
MDVPEACSGPEFRRRFFATIRRQLMERGFRVDTYDDRALDLMEDVYTEVYKRIRSRTGKSKDPVVSAPIDNWLRFFCGFSRRIAWEKQKNEIRARQDSAEQYCAEVSPEAIERRIERVPDPSMPTDQKLASRQRYAELMQLVHEIDPSDLFRCFLELREDGNSIRDALQALGAPQLRSTYERRLQALRAAIIERSAERGK